MDCATCRNFRPAAVCVDYHGSDSTLVDFGYRGACAAGGCAAPAALVPLSVMGCGSHSAPVDLWAAVERAAAGVN